jgi:integrase
VPLLGAISLADNAYLKRRCGRGRSGYRWYVRVPVPSDLQEVLRKRSIEQALNTSDLTEARRLKHAVVAGIFADFERARLGRITSADMEQESQRYLRERLQEILERPGDTFTPGQDEFGGELPPDGELALFELCKLAEDEDWPAGIDREADAIARRYGTTLTAEQRKELCSALLRAEIQAVQRALAAHNGDAQEPVPVLNGHAIDPLTAEVALPARLPHRKGKGLRVSEAAKFYVAKRNRDKKNAWTGQTRKQAQATLRLFADFTRDAPLASVTRKDVAAFLSGLAKLGPGYGRNLRDQLSLNQLLEKYRSSGEGLGNKTLNRHCGVLVGLFGWAISEGKFEGLNPAKGHHRADSNTGDDPDARRYFEPDELQKLFAGPLFQVSWEERVQPKIHTPDSTLAWIIPIALYSGMRLDEICGLRTQDVGEDSGVLFFNVISYEGRRVKTAASRRRIPVHSELLRIGFGEYLAHVRQQGHDYLFPALKPGGPDGKRSWYISKRFTEYRRSVGVKSPATVFHCFRKNAATALERARVPENEAVQVLGHKKLTMSYGLYSGGLDLPALVQVVEAITYPGLDTKHLQKPIQK